MIVSVMHVLVGRKQEVEKRTKMKDSVKQLRAVKQTMQSPTAVHLPPPPPPPLHALPPHLHLVVKTDIAGRFSVDDSLSHADANPHTVTSPPVSHDGVNLTLTTLRF